MLVHGNERARFERGGMVRQNAYDHVADGVWEDILGTHLHDARTGSSMRFDVTARAEG